MRFFHAVILGLVQGLSEFLPISSSGHLAIFGRVFRLDPEADSLLSFNILLHVATLLAVVIVYRADIWAMIKDFFAMIGDIIKGKGARLETGEYRKMALMLIVGTVPAVFAALLLGDFVADAPLWAIGVFLFMTALLLLLSEKLSRGKADMSSAKIPSAFWVGCFQAVAILPGLSRSGSTIVGGLFCGLKKEFAVKFSFLLSIPAILGALIFDLKDIVEMGAQSASVLNIIFGMAAAFISGFFAIKFLIRLVARGSLRGFAYYCALAGAAAIILNFAL